MSYVLSFSLLHAIAVEEQAFRDELEAAESNARVTYEKYQEELAKLLEPRRQWDFNLEYVLFPLAAIAFGVVLIFFIRQIRRNLIHEIPENQDIEPTAENIQTESAAIAHAETAIEANDFRNALRYLYLSAILHLQERGILPYDNSLTNREYLHQSQVDNDLQTKLGPAVTVFDEVWYGHKPCDKNTVADYRELLQKVYSS